MKRCLKGERMNLRKLLVLTLALAVAIPALAQSQPKPPNPADIAKHQVKTLTTLLSLTSAQQQQALTIYTNSATAQQTVIETDKTTHDSLHAAIKNNDSAAIDQLASTLAQSNAQLTSIRAKADAAFYQILTAEQQTKYSELESQHIGPPDAPGAGPGAMGFH
jgi:Spy/CpxP family protein refolding chaperone